MRKLKGVGIDHIQCLPRLLHIKAINAILLSGLDQERESSKAEPPKERVSAVSESGLCYSQSDGHQLTCHDHPSPAATPCLEYVSSIVGFHLPIPKSSVSYLRLSCPF